MKYVINIDEDNPISVTDREIVYMDNETGMTWTISKNGKKKLKPLEEMENNVPYMIKIPDVVSRKEAIDAVEHITSSMSVCVNTDECHGMKRMQRQAVIELANLPSVQDEIAKAVAAVIEQPSITRCKDCKHYNAGFECLIEGYGIERDED